MISKWLKTHYLRIFSSENPFSGGKKIEKLPQQNNQSNIMHFVGFWEKGPYDMAILVQNLRNHIF